MSTSFDGLDEWSKKCKPGAKLNFNVKAWEAMRRSNLSEEHAKAALLEVARIIRDGEPLPLGVAEWVAGAIETAVNMPERLSPITGDTGDALLIGLGLRSNNKRQACDYLDVGRVVGDLLHDGKLSKTAAIQAAAKKLRIGYGTAQAKYTKYCEAMDAHNSEIE